MESGKLIKLLRICANSDLACTPCPYFGKRECVDLLLNEAANKLAFLTCDKEEKKAMTKKRRIRLDSAISADTYLYSPYIWRMSDDSEDSIIRRYMETL